MIINAGFYNLSTGRTFGGGANGAIGLSVNTDEITVGYDYQLRLEDPEGDDLELTTAEKIEIAEFMVARWTDFIVTLVMRVSSNVGPAKSGGSQ
jgi:hypothetical protein